MDHQSLVYASLAKYLQGCPSRTTCQWYPGVGALFTVPDPDYYSISYYYLCQWRTPKDRLMGEVIYKVTV